MLGLEFVEELPGGPQPSLPGVLQALADALIRIGAGGDVEQALVGFRILHNSRGLPIYREDHGALALLELFHEIAGSAPEGGQGLDILRDVKRGPTPMEAPFKVLLEYHACCKSKKGLVVQTKPSEYTDPSEMASTAGL